MAAGLGSVLYSALSLALIGIQMCPHLEHNMSWSGSIYLYLNPHLHV